MRIGMILNQGRQVEGRRPIVLLIVSAILMVACVPVSGQQKYSADHPDVEAMVEKGIKYLRASGNKQIGELTLTALAIAQARKRYYQEAPADDPVVNEAIAEILKRIPPVGSKQAESGAKNLLMEDEVYVPCLALILLAEVNDSKYKIPINRLLNSLEERQTDAGAFNYRIDTPDTGDTSQTQYVALAFFVAKQHGFPVKPEAAAAALNWLIASQQPSGAFHYKLRQANPNAAWIPVNGAESSTLSIHAGGLGTAYLLDDLLQLNPRKKTLSKVVVNDETYGLPKTVSVYVKPLVGGESLLNRTGPLVDFEKGKLNSTYGSGNRFFENNFNIISSQWTFYYLYALERYAWFREQIEGNLGGGKIADWYDTGVEFLKSNQAEDGSFYRAEFSVENQTVSTSFAILFLVRSSEVISNPSASTEMAGGQGFPTDQVIVARNGEVVGSEAEQNLSDMIGMLKQDPTPEQMAALTKSMKTAVIEFKNKEDKSRREVKSFLRTMISAQDYYRRKIAVRFLAGEQDMDNVPALIYALGDPDLRICIEAHDGLRLISRKIDSLQVSETTRRNAERAPAVLTSAQNTSARLEFDSLKKKWTDWFLKIRPSAEMLD